MISTTPRDAVPLDALVALLQLERTGNDTFCGRSQAFSFGYIFGGQFIAQSLAAAGQTTELPVHSIHSYFLRKGDESQPVAYEVERIRDGRSFATRRVVARQGGHAAFTLTASFQREELGHEHQAAMPPTPGPEGVPRQRSFQHAVEVREVEPQEPREPLRRIWFRATGPLPDDPAVHRHVLAWASDMNLIKVAMQVHGLTFDMPDMHTASLDHAIWFHRPFRMDEWLLYVNDSPSASGARGFTRGQFFTQDGRLVASTAQEGLIRRA